MDSAAAKKASCYPGYSVYLGNPAEAVLLQHPVHVSDHLAGQAETVHLHAGIDFIESVIGCVRVRVFVAFPGKTDARDPSVVERVLITRRPRWRYYFK